MARRHRRRTKRNPTGTLLVNAGKRGRAKRAKRSKRVVSLAGLFSKVAKHNPRRRTRKAAKRRNPSVRRRASRRGVRRSAHRRNPLAINPRKRRHHKRRHHKRNPLAVNPRKRRYAKRRGHKRNPIMINRRRGSKRRHNPDMLKGTLGKVQGMAKRLPFVGGILATAVGLLGAAAGGAIGVLPISYIMPHVGKYMPTWLRPYGYTIAGAAAAAVIKAIPVSVPYKTQLMVGMAAAGGAVDMYRFRHGKSQDLGDEYGGYYYGGDGDVGDIGEYGDLSDGDPLAAVEWAGCALADAEYAGDDLSGEEMAAAELGRAVYLRRFPPRHAKPPGSPAESSGHAGHPGERWGWLIYWIGFENFQKLSALPEEKRRAVIMQAKREAHAAARKLLSQQMDTGMTTAETAGLLVAA